MIPRLLASTALAAVVFAPLGALVALALVASEPTMPQPFGDLYDRSHELVIGVPGSGKTYLTRQRVATARRVVFASPTLDYIDDGELVDVDDLDDDDEGERLRGATLRLVMVLGEDDRDPGEDLAALVRYLRRHAPRRGELVLVCDEVGDYGRPGTIGAVTLERLHRNGHHDGIASILVSQCAVDIPLTCRRTATRVTSLLQTRSEDLAALEREYGRDFRDRVSAWSAGDPPVAWVLPTLYQRG